MILPQNLTIRLPALFQKCSLREHFLFYTVCILLVVFLSIVSLRARDSRRNDPVRIVYALYEEEEAKEGTGAFFMMKGKGLGGTISGVGDFLYRQDADGQRIVGGLLRQSFMRTFGNENDLFLVLSRFSDAPYAFFLRAGEDEWEWLLSSSPPTEDISSLLHVGFASQYSPGRIRERLLPDGRTVRDIIAEKDGLQQSEEHMNGYRIRSTTFLRDRRHFLSAENNRIVILSNSRALLLQAIR